MLNLGDLACTQTALFEDEAVPGLTDMTGPSSSEDFFHQIRHIGDVKELKTDLVSCSPG